MKLARNNLGSAAWARVLSAVFALGAWGQACAASDLLIHGAGRISEGISPVWLAIVDTSPGGVEGTTVLVREKFGDSDWRSLGRIPLGAQAITSHNAELVVFFKDGTWAWYSASRFSYGPPLPKREKIVALAGDRASLWAIGRARDGSTTAAVTAPTTTNGLTLYSLSGAAWTGRECSWPAEVDARRVNALSMAVIKQVPHLAVIDADGVVRIFRYEAGKSAWEVAGERQAGGTAARVIKLIGISDRPAVWGWEQGAAGLGRVWTAEQTMTLAASPGGRVEDLDVTVAGDQFWAVYGQPDGKQGTIVFQRFGLDGSASDSKPIPLTWARGREESPMQWLTIALMTMLTLVVLSSLLKRRAAARNQGGPSEE